MTLDAIEKGGLRAVSMIASVEGNRSDELASGSFNAATDDAVKLSGYGCHAAEIFREFRRPISQRAFGSAAHQVAGLATGIPKSFSFADAALAATRGGIGAGLGLSGQFGLNGFLRRQRFVAN